MNPDGEPASKRLPVDAVSLESDYGSDIDPEDVAAIDAAIQAAEGKEPRTAAPPSMDGSESDVSELQVQIPLPLYAPSPLPERPNSPPLDPMDPSDDFERSLRAPYYYDPLHEWNGPPSQHPLRRGSFRQQAASTAEAAKANESDDEYGAVLDNLTSRELDKLEADAMEDMEQAQNEAELIFDRSTLAKARPELYTRAIFEMDYGRQPNDRELGNVLVRQSGTTTYRQRKIPDKVDGRQSAGLEGDDPFGEMDMMVRHPSGYFFWIRPKLEKEEKLQAWITEYGGKNVWLKAEEGEYLTPDDYDTRFGWNAAENVYATFKGQPVREYVPKTIVHVNKHMNASPEDQALYHLKEVLRHHRAVFVPAKRKADFHDQIKPSEALNKLREISTKLVRTLGEFIPSHPIYNGQCISALEIILDNGLVQLDPETDKARIASVLAEIHAKRPQFAAEIPVDTILELYTRLQDYSKIKDCDPRQFPPMELVGHRSEELRLSAHDPGLQSAPIRNQAELKDNLRQIGELLGKVAPEVEYCDELRYELVDHILADGEDLANWFARDREIATIRAAKGQLGFIPNKFHFLKQTFIQELNNKVRPWKSELAKVGLSRQLTPQAAIAIGQLIEEYHRASKGADDNNTSRDGEPATNRRRLSLQARPVTVSKLYNVPVGLRDAVRIAPAPALEINPQATRIAHNIAVSLDGLIAPQRGNFASRVDFIFTVSRNRAHWLASSGSNATHSLTLYSLLRNYSGIFKMQDVKVHALAKTLDDYHKAWAGKLQVREEAVRPVARAGGNVDATRVLGHSTSLDGKIAPQSRVTTALAKAGKAPGQSKLNFGSGQEAHRRIPPENREDRSSSR